MSMSDVEPQAGSSKFERFKKALDALCRSHKVYLCPSDYDLLQVWDEDAHVQGVSLDRIEDCTKPSA